MQRLGSKMYRPRLLHGLLEDDLDRCLQFCKVLLNEKRQSITQKICWSDEANFKLSGAANTLGIIVSRVLLNRKPPCNN
jgi:hypothetical protein